MIWTKGAHQSAKFQTVDCSRKISSNLYFDRLLKFYKILAKKLQRSYVSWPWRLMQNLKKKKQIDLLFQKWQEFVKFDQSTRKYKKFAFSFVPIMQSI